MALARLVARRIGPVLRAATSKTAATFSGTKTNTVAAFQATRPSAVSRPPLRRPSFSRAATMIAPHAALAMARPVAHHAETGTTVRASQTRTPLAQTSTCGPSAHSLFGTPTPLSVRSTPPKVGAPPHMIVCVLAQGQVGIPILHLPAGAQKHAPAAGAAAMWGAGVMWGAG